MRQRPNGQTSAPYQGEDNTAIATLNILSNPSVVAAIVNAAKNESINGSQGNNRSA